MKISMFLPAVVFLAVSGAQAAPDTPSAPLDLTSALQIAVSNNAALSAARANAEASEAQVKQARAASGPTASVSSSYGFLSEETVFGGMTVVDQNTLGNRLEVQQVLYSGGAVQAAIDRALYGAGAADAAREAVRAEVLAGVSEVYFRVLQAREGVSAASSSVVALEASVDASQKLRDAGVVTNADVLRAQVALASAKENLIAAENAHSVALANLKKAMGVPQSAELVVSGEHSLPADVDSIEQARRAEVTARQSALNASIAAKRIAQAGKKPVVAVAADFYNEPTGSEFPRVSNTLGIGLQVKLNVFDSGLTEARVDEAEASIRAAEQNLRDTEQAVDLQVETARMNLSSARARLATTANQVAAAEESLRVLQAGYAEGINPLTDVLAAESALTGARFARIAAENNVRVAEVNLLRALGRTDLLIGQERE